MNQALEISEVNRLHFLKQISDAERSRRIFQIREKYEKQTNEIITDPIEIEKAFREDDL